MAANTLVYFLDNTMYINVTNKCTCKCVFCIRSISDEVAGKNLWLDSEDIKAEDIIEQIVENSSHTPDEIVFCGYGEPLIKLDLVKEVAKFIKENIPNVPVRVNTNGHGNLIHRRNIVPELIGLIDKVSVSLNTSNTKQYKELTRCSFDANIAYDSMKDFIKKCADAKIDTTATVVSGFQDYEINLEACEKLAKQLGAKFKVREWLDEGYN